MVRLALRSFYRSVLGVQDERKLYEKKVKTLKATRRKSLSERERNELQWLSSAQKCIDAGSLTACQVKVLKSYRTLSPAAQIQKLEQKHAKIRRQLGLLHGHMESNGGHYKAQDVLNENHHQLRSGLETREATSSFRQADSLSPQPPGAVTASIPSPVEISPDPGKQSQTTPIQHPGGSRPLWRVWGSRNATKGRFLRAKERLFLFFWKTSPSQQGSFYDRTENAHRLSNFFTRRDMLFFHMFVDPLRFCQPPPVEHQDLFEAATRVVRVEQVIGYRFKNKMLCVEALKASRHDVPLYWQGVVTPIADNRRLALIGDRVLALGMTTLW